MNQPFDNETLRTKTVWKYEELLHEYMLIYNAISVLDVMGDRFAPVVNDLRALLNTRASMLQARSSG